MLCKYPENLEVEREVVRRPLCPEIAIPLTVLKTYYWTDGSRDELMCNLAVTYTLDLCLAALLSRQPPLPRPTPTSLLLLSFQSE